MQVSSLTTSIFRLQQAKEDCSGAKEELKKELKVLDEVIISPSFYSIIIHPVFALLFLSVVFHSPISQVTFMVIRNNT